MTLSTDIFQRFNPYLKGSLIRSRALRRELEQYTETLQKDYADKPEIAQLIGRIGTVLDDMLSRQNTRTTPLHVRMVQGCVRVFMRSDRLETAPDFDFDLAVLNETARTIRRPKLQIFPES